MKTIKYASIRLPPEIHKAVKVRAASEDKLMCDWIAQAVMEKLNKKE